MRRLVLIACATVLLSGCDALMRVTTDPSGGLPAGPGDDPVFHVSLTGGESFDLIEGDAQVSVSDAEAGAGPLGGTVFQTYGATVEIDDFGDDSDFGRTLVVRQEYTTLGDIGDEQLRLNLESTSSDEHIRVRLNLASANGGSSLLEFRSENGSGHDATDNDNFLVADEVHTLGFGGSAAQEALLVRNSDLVHETEGYGWTDVAYGELDTVRIEVREAEMEITDIMLFDYRLSPQQVDALF